MTEYQMTEMGIVAGKKKENVKTKYKLIWYIRTMYNILKNK